MEDLEYYVPLMRLQEEGAQILTAGLDLKPVHGKNGLEITPDTRIADLNADDLFALIVPGGWAPDKLRRHSVVKIWSTIWMPRERSSASSVMAA